MPSGKKTAKKGKASKAKPAKSKPAAAKAKKPTKTPAKATKAKAGKPKPAPKKAKPAPKKAKPPAKKPPAKAKAKAPPPPKKAKPAPAKKAKPAPAPKPAKAAPPAKPAKAAPPAKAVPAAKAVTAAPAAAPAAKPAPARKAAATAAPTETPAPAAAKKTKKKPIPTMSMAATPIIRPFGDDAPPAAPPPPPAKPGHVDHQVLSSITYGLFAAINKTFGFAGQSVVKNAALRMLEYGYKRGWLPPKSREPVRALNEFFGRLETMGYADKIHVAKHGDKHVLEVHGLADFDAVWSLREMHYPLLPVFLGAMLEAIVDQYFGLKVALDPLEMREDKRGLNISFAMHERPAATDVSRLVQYSRVEDLDE